MERVRRQAKEMFPNVYLTLLSMIQALALEVLWSAVNEREHLWVGDATAAIGWLQVTAMLQLMFLVWIAVAHFVIRLRWVMSVRDSAIPFAVGMAQFTLIGLIRPATVHLWFYGLAAIMTFGVWAARAMTRDAEREPDNLDVVKAVGRANLTPTRPVMIAGVPFGLVAGGLIQWFGGTGWLALVLVALANAMAFGLILRSARGWRLAVDARDSR